MMIGINLIIERNRNERTEEESLELFGDCEAGRRPLDAASSVLDWIHNERVAAEGRGLEPAFASMPPSTAGDRLGASLPGSAAGASWKAPVDTIDRDEEDPSPAVAPVAPSRWRTAEGADGREPKLSRQREAALAIPASAKSFRGRFGGAPAAAPWAVC
jgi:hypothetical protein